MSSGRKGQPRVPRPVVLSLTPREHARMAERGRIEAAIKKAVPKGWAVEVTGITNLDDEIGAWVIVARHRNKRIEYAMKPDTPPDVAAKKLADACAAYARTNANGGAA
jgi:hypothetical protein